MAFTRAQIDAIQGLPTSAELVVGWDGSDYQPLKVDTSGRLVGVGMADTTEDTGTVTSPGAAATIIGAMGVSPAGVYNLEGSLTLSGTAETALLNVVVRVGLTELGKIPTISGQTIYFAFKRATAPGGVDFNIITVAAAVAGAIYTSRLAATRIE